MAVAGAVKLNAHASGVNAISAARHKSLSKDEKVRWRARTPSV